MWNSKVLVLSVCETFKGFVSIDGMRMIWNHSHSIFLNSRGGRRWGELEDISDNFKGAQQTSEFSSNPLLFGKEKKVEFELTMELILELQAKFELG